MAIVPPTTWSRFVVERDASTTTYAASSFIRQPLYQAIDDINLANDGVVPITVAQADALLAACVASMNIANALPASTYGRFELMCFLGSYNLIVACKENDGVTIDVSGEIPISGESGPIPLSAAQTLLAAAWARSKAVNGV